MTRSTSHNQRINPQSVNGWGIDADPQNDPTYPYRARVAEDQTGMNWERPPLQQFDVEILSSVEHNRLPAVSGTAHPPRGLSGVLRRMAFMHSESDWRHWLTLMAADRLEVGEELLRELLSGRVPNIPREMGIRAEWQHNRANLVTKAMIAVGVSALLITLLRRR